jgi:transcriptional regulator with XRE-family HTH domain
MNRADRFRLVREFYHKNQAEMADLVGIRRNTWGRYEAGDMPSGETLDQLSALGFSIDWLLTGKGLMIEGSVELDPITDIIGEVNHGHNPIDGEPMGRGQQELLKIPKYPIPFDLEEALRSVDGLLRSGPRAYPVALFNAKYLVELIEEKIVKR